MVKELTNCLGAMKDTKDMINMVLALQLMEKVMEVVGEILDKFVNGDSQK